MSDHPKCEHIVLLTGGGHLRESNHRRSFASGGLDKWKIIKSSSPKVVRVAYERWLFTRDSRCRALTEPNFGVLHLWLLMGGGRLQKLVAHAEVRLYIQL